MTIGVDKKKLGLFLIVVCVDFNYCVVHGSWIVC